MIFAKGFPMNVFILGCLLVIVSSKLCSNRPCVNGKCVEAFDPEFRCSCWHGWKGETCEENVNDCIQNPCKNGGTCIDKKNSQFTCNCTSQFIGNLCQFENPCLNVNCENGGTCESLENGMFQCKCRYGFIGEFCAVQNIACPVIPKKKRELCNNHGECDIYPNMTLFCKCDPGYTGDRCDKKKELPVEIGCKSDYCFNGGVCKVLDNGSPICECKGEFTGKNCTIPLKETRKEALINIKIPKTFNEKQLIIKKTKSPSLCDNLCKASFENGICDQQCNTFACNYDGGDCDPWRKCYGNDLKHCKGVFNDGVCNPECNNVDCLFDGEDCHKSSCKFHKCSELYQNKICDEECNSPQCGFDGGDCHTSRSNSFFSNEGLTKCSTQTKLYELDLVLMTTMQNFTKYKSEFLQKLSSSLRMVVTVFNVTEINFNFATALLIKLHVNYTQCVLYGGQCFSSLEQISNFLKAGIEKGNVLSLPFRLARVDTRIISASKKQELPIYTMILAALLLLFFISITLIGVLLRDKWGKLRSKIKTAGVWTPSSGYSTSTSPINSGYNFGWPKLPQLKDFKKEYQIPNKLIYGESQPKTDQHRHLHGDQEPDNPISINNRKRKYETINRNHQALAFQLISDSLESTDGIHPIDAGLGDVYTMASVKNHMKYDEKYQTSSLEGLGEYVNENGESLMHIAARMNSGANIIKQINAINPSMLHSLDEWGRTPLASSIAADATESTEQLLILEKQLRKESKQNKVRSGINGINLGTPCEYFVKKTTALIEAVKLDSKEMISLLLDEGSPVNVLDSQGRSVVHWSAMFNNSGLLERLSHMKIFQKLADLKDNEDKSPLFLAANEGAIDSVKYLLAYFNKSSIKMDPNCPCPKLIAEEKGFYEIRDLIQETLRKVTITDRNEKKTKSKESKTKNKIHNFDTSGNLCIIDEYKELSSNSLENLQSSPLGNESIDSCLLDLYSITDPMQNPQEPYSNEKSLYSSFKPVEHRYHGYQSNTSSSDMSPPLLNLNNQQFQNGFNSITHSEHLDSNYSNSIFLSPKSFIGLPDPINGSGLNKATDFQTDFYNYQASPILSEYKYYSNPVPKFPPVNCLL
nr:notch 4 [Schmidtea mediterranea]